MCLIITDKTYSCKELCLTYMEFYDNNCLFLGMVAKEAKDHSADGEVLEPERAVPKEAIISSRALFRASKRILGTYGYFFAYVGSWMLREKVTLHIEGSAQVFLSAPGLDLGEAPIIKVSAGEPYEHLEVSSSKSILSRVVRNENGTPEVRRTQATVEQIDFYTKQVKLAEQKLKKSRRTVKKPL